MTRMAPQGCFNSLCRLLLYRTLFIDQDCINHEMNAIAAAVALRLKCCARPGPANMSRATTIRKDRLAKHVRAPLHSTLTCFVIVSFFLLDTRVTPCLRDHPAIKQNDSSANE
jgi:hypothetical protein